MLELPTLPTSSQTARPGNRCATRRFPRSGPTVHAVGKRSLDVQSTLSFGTSTLPLLDASLHSGAHQSLYEAVHLHPCIGLDSDD